MGTSLSDSSVVLAIMGISTKLNATAPANAENVFVVATSMMKTNSPSTIDGNPVSTSFINPETLASLVEDHSEKKMPAPTPIGIEKSVARPTISREPTIALATPPPGRVGAVGKLVKNVKLMAGAPIMKISVSMYKSGITAKITATIIKTVIKWLMSRRQREIFVGKLDFVKIVTFFRL